MQEDFEAFCAQARDGCLRAVLVSTTDPHLAEELVAEAFARAWARWPAVRRHPAPAAWVVRTALNLRVSRWRRLRREVSSEEPASPTASASSTATRASAGGVDDVPGVQDLLGLLARLPERQRQVLALRVFLDLDIRATADALGIAEGTVTAHLHRATSTLRRLVEADRSPGRRSPDHPPGGPPGPRPPALPAPCTAPLAAAGTTLRSLR